MTKPFSLAFKQKMVARLTGKDAVSARQLALETGLRQQTLPQWRQLVPRLADEGRYLASRPPIRVCPFTSSDAARQWVTRFVSWHNTEHRHSAIRYITPDERHAAGDVASLACRRVLYERARQRTPERWSGNIRNRWLKDSMRHPDQRDNYLTLTAGLICYLCRRSGPKTLDRFCAPDAFASEVIPESGSCTSEDCVRATIVDYSTDRAHRPAFSKSRGTSSVEKSRGMKGHDDHIVPVHRSL